MESPTRTCQEFSESLDAFRDDELPVEERKLVSAHLAQCNICANKLNEIDKVVQALQTLPKVQLDTHSSAKLDQIIAQSSKVSPINKRIWAPIAAAAAVAAIVFGLKLTGPNNAVLLEASTHQSNRNEIATNSASGSGSGAKQPNGIAGSAKPPELKVAQANTSGNSTFSPKPLDLDSDSEKKVQKVLPVTKKIADTAEKKAPKPLHNHSSDQQAVNQRPQIAARPASIPTTSVSTTHGESLDESIVADLSGGGFNEAIGLATDEDGLYDIKM